MPTSILLFIQITATLSCPPKLTSSANRQLKMTIVRISDSVTWTSASVTWTSDSVTWTSDSVTWTSSSHQWSATTRYARRPVIRRTFPTTAWMYTNTDPCSPHLPVPSPLPVRSTCSFPLTTGSPEAIRICRSRSTTLSISSPTAGSRSGSDRRVDP